MFSKRITDVKKSTTKIQDFKKDVATRAKHLKIILGTLFTSWPRYGAIYTLSGLIGVRLCCRTSS